MTNTARVRARWVLGVAGAVFVLLLGGFLAFVFGPFGAPTPEANLERFVVPVGMERSAAIEKLADEGFIKSAYAFSLVHRTGIEPGAYRLAGSMHAFAISDALSEGPYLVWVTIPEGYRKEQIAELMREAINWTPDDVRIFLTAATEGTADTSEGVYFPDTYLVAVGESPESVAERLRARFSEVFAPYAEEALRQNIRWPTLLKVASLVEREAAGADDMPLVAGIIWNRLLAEQRLEIDATVQYVRDTLENYTVSEVCLTEELCPEWPGIYHGAGAATEGWWRPIAVADKDLMPFNTYRFAGLPPRPIANPGERAIQAALYPEETECMFYLHDADGVIHCAVSYDEHQENIERHLR